MNKSGARNLTVFIVMAIASGWVGVLADGFLDDQPEGNTLGMLLWLVLPPLTAILLRSFAGDGWKDSGLAPRLRSSWAWYGAALLAYPLVTSLVLLAGWATGGTDTANLRLGSLSGVFASLVPGLFIKNIFEEFAWRGYLTARLANKGLRDWSLYGTVGLIWGVWHLPYYFFFLPDETMYSLLPVHKMEFALIAMASIVASSILYVELFRATRSVWPGVLMHTVENALLNPLVVDGYITFAKGGAIWLSPVMGLLPALLYAAAGMIVRSIRLRQA